jgi:hypothetical protein
MKMMLTCAEAGRLITESQDRHLGFVEWFALRFHLLMCKICPAYERQLIVLRALMSQWAPKLASAPSPATAPCLSEEARGRISEAIRRAK